MTLAAQDLPDLDGDVEVDSAAVEGFQRDGHTVVRGLASADEAAAYRPHIESAVREDSKESRPIEERDTYGKAFLQITNLWRRHEAVRRFTLSRRFGKVAAELLGVPAVRLYHDQALFKEAGGGRTPFHQDQFYWPFDSDRTITMWMPLVDVGADIGSMTFASGSHRLGYVGQFAISDEGDRELRKVIDDNGLALDTHGTLAAGDATFHAGWTLHGAPPNPTGTLRSVMTVIYIADGLRVVEPDHPYRAFDLKTWLPGVQPGELAASEINPGVYSAAE